MENTVKRGKKRIAITIGALVLAVVVLTGAVFWLYVTHLHFVYDNVTVRVSSAPGTAQTDISDYAINHPKFRNISGFTDQYESIYGAVTGPLAQYAMDIATEYDNYAQLNYTVEIADNATVTVVFTGFGYPGSGAGEPVPLNKTFVFDIKDVTPEKLPVLV